MAEKIVDPNDLIHALVAHCAHGHGQVVWLDPPMTVADACRDADGRLPACPKCGGVMTAAASG